MTESPFFSIITPIYNAEAYLERSLQSIRHQTYPNYEVILVDDGSTDRSAEICKEFTLLDSRFWLFHQENKGVSAARNLGLDYAKGKYVLFVDSDDEIDLQMLEFVHNSICVTEQQLLIFDYQSIDKASLPISRYHFAAKPGLYSKKEYMRTMTHSVVSYYVGVLWNKVYDLNIIKARRLRFDSAVTLGEDFIFNMAYLESVEKIQCVDRKLYLYREQDANSLSKKHKDESQIIEERLKMFQAYKNLYQHEGLEKKRRMHLYFYLIKVYFDELDRLGKDSYLYKKMLYQKWIKDAGVPRIEFGVVALLKKIRRAVRSARRS